MMITEKYYIKVQEYKSQNKSVMISKVSLSCRIFYTSVEINILENRELYFFYHFFFVGGALFRFKLPEHKLLPTSLRIVNHWSCCDAMFASELNRIAFVESNITATSGGI